jgi:hypothetical protein
MQFSELPIVFLSFDEPYADAHYKRLTDRIPAAKRVHGVKGLDAVHKAAAAEVGDVPMFLTVDADNIVLEEFWHVYTDARPAHLYGKTLSWKGFNACNGLTYGNGGLKLWKTDFVKSMVTHEQAVPGTKGTVDFCWDQDYVQMRATYSVTDFTSSPYHSWRAGFREGVKMPLRDGAPPPDPKGIKSWSYQSCLSRFTQWASVGRDRGYGGWAILGALEGFYKVHVTRQLELDVISDYDWFTNHWSDNYARRNVFPSPFDYPDVRADIQSMIDDILDTCEIYVPILGPNQSRTVKEWLVPARTETYSAYEVDECRSITY